MWTLPALASEATGWSGDLWRLVESQSAVATLKLVDTLDEQAILEAELEGSKPLVPASWAHLDYLLATPFRYAPYRTGSRFRRDRSGKLVQRVDRVENPAAAAQKVEAGLVGGFAFTIIFVPPAHKAPQDTLGLPRLLGACL